MSGERAHSATAAADRPGAEESALLRVEDLAVSFDAGGGMRTQAVDGVSLTIYPNQTVALVGESGCGKSVTAMSLLRLLPGPAARVDRGRAMLETGEGVRDLLAMSEREIRGVRGGRAAMIFQEPMTSLNPVYSVGDQIIEAVRLHRRATRGEAERIAEEAMTSVGIPEPRARMNAYPHQFSGGMRQRVMIAMALACRPALLLADEPTTALDVTIQAQILELLRDLRRTRGLSIMLITHDLGVVAENADVVCVMYAGRVVEYADVNELFRNPLHPYTRGLLASIPRVGEVRERLTTIAEVVDRADAFGGLPGRGGRGLQPWWPWREPPGRMNAKTRAEECALCEVLPGHWVGVWRTDAVASECVRTPDIAFRASGSAASSANAGVPE